MSPVFLTAELRSLVMINYAVDRAVLDPLLPRGLELDLWEGTALVSMVGFLFLDCRVLGIPIPFHRNFEEVNLRFYVRRRVGGEWRRGVTFIREIVPRRAVAWLARAIYNEPYRALPMRHRIADGTFEFEWKFARAWYRLGAAVRGEAQAITPGSEEDFIFENYWGYTQQRDGGTIEYAVEHAPWEVWPTERSWFDCDAGALYGPAFAEPLRCAPRSAFVAVGSPIVLHHAVRIA